MTTRCISTRSLPPRPCSKGVLHTACFRAALISAVLGTRLPGPGCIYISQEMKFKAPVRIGDTVTATATVKEVNTERRRVVLETVCTVKGKMVLDGEAVLMVNSRG